MNIYHIYLSASGLSNLGLLDRNRTNRLGGRGKMWLREGTERETDCGAFGDMETSAVEKS